jgi:hypothetical protein
VKENGRYNPGFGSVQKIISDHLKKKGRLKVISETAFSMVNIRFQKKESG